MQAYLSTLEGGASVINYVGGYLDKVCENKLNYQDPIRAFNISLFQPWHVFSVVLFRLVNLRFN